MRIELEPIGHVESIGDVPDDDSWGGEEACIVLSDRFTPDAFTGIDDFSHVEVLFLFDRVDPSEVVFGSRHPRDNTGWPSVGIFAQRAKSRPNRIGSTICRVLGVDGIRLYVSELDAVTGTPVLDIKPVMVEFLPRVKLRQPSWSRELMKEYWKQKL
jgi:tRNA-Thr(GGU) m(6)t(6)A37 methyltransferase TsaA